MKKIILVLDGVADRPNKALNGKTPLTAASKPCLDGLAKKSRLGCVKTIPDGLEVGSAVANMSLLGLDPRLYKGRAVIEAAGVGLPTSAENLYVRTNFVELDGPDYAHSCIKSYSAGDIATEQSRPLTRLLCERVFKPPYVLHNVGTFRNILEVEGGKGLYPLNFAPAHDIIGQPISQYVGGGGKERPFFELQQAAYDALSGNGTRANGVWFWGASIMPEFAPATGNRCVFSETILMRGITSIARLENHPTAEGRPLTEFLRDKAERAAAALNSGYDEAYIHIQEPDDLSHELMPERKTQAVEEIDRAFVEPFLGSLKGDFRLVVTSDHYTFSDTGAHGAEPAPFMLYDSTVEEMGERYTEDNCRGAGLKVDAPGLRELLLK